MERLKNNACISCICSQTCAICYAVWSLISIVALLTYGLVEGEANYQKINAALMTDEERATVMSGAFIASFLYGLCILGCLISFLYGLCKRDPAHGAYQRV